MWLAHLPASPTCNLKPKIQHHFSSKAIQKCTQENHNKQSMKKTSHNSQPSWNSAITIQQNSINQSSHKCSTSQTRNSVPKHLHKIISEFYEQSQLLLVWLERWGCRTITWGMGMAWSVKFATPVSNTPHKKDSQESAVVSLLSPFHLLNSSPCWRNLIEEKWPCS